MSTTEITEVLVLAAVDRAVRHQQTGAPRSAPRWTIYEHLDVPARSQAARLLRAQLAALEGSALTRSKRHGVEAWELSNAGKRRLSRLRATGRLPELPESPQHRAWREARALAEQRIEAFELAVAAAIEDAQARLDGAIPGPQVLHAPGALPGPRSDAWFELGERLHQACKRLASAAYCLGEWPEPQDARADVDSHEDPSDKAFDPGERLNRRCRRQGRRNTLLWDSNPAVVSIGQTIRREREQQDLTAGELAGKAGITKAHLESLESGRVDPDYVALISLACALNIKSASLVADVDHR